MQQASAALAKVLKEVLRHAPPEEAVRLVWPLVCGTQVAQCTSPLDFTQGQLRVEVPDQAWQTQLRELAPRYVREFHDVLGKATVEQIQFVIRS